MRILVYGAGVQGCELAHRLVQNEKNTVTLLARGEWKERIDQKGLTIRHWAQLKTTVDRVPTIETLAPEESYDIVFVTVQAGQVPEESCPSSSRTRASFLCLWATSPMLALSCRPCSARRIRSRSASRTTADAGKTARSSVSTRALA